MTQIPRFSDVRCLGGPEKQKLEDKLLALQQALDAFPDAANGKLLEPENLFKAEEWAKPATIAIFNLFNVLVAIPHPPRRMDLAIEYTRQSFHAVFELAFCSVRDPNAEDFQRARMALESALNACKRLLAESSAVPDSGQLH